MFIAFGASSSSRLGAGSVSKLRFLKYQGEVIFSCFCREKGTHFIHGGEVGDQQKATSVLEQKHFILTQNRK